MAGPTFQPPIHLDPNQDSSQQTAFINQNFQNLAATLESNSFRVVQSGVDSQALSTATGAGPITHTIAHNLGIIPTVIAYVACDNPFTALSPLPTYTPGQYMATESNLYTTQSGVSYPIFAITIFFDTVNIYINYLQNWLTAGQTYTYTINYSILQQKAN